MHRRINERVKETIQLGGALQWGAVAVDIDEREEGRALSGLRWVWRMSGPC